MFNNRQIKFRVWDNKYQQFVNPEIISVNSFNDFFQNKIYTFQEFTGLKDKNNREICEGDIVKVQTEDDPEDLQWELIDVVYINGCFMFDNKHPDPLYDFLEKGLVDVEIVGNIFENPKLLNNTHGNKPKIICLCGSLRFKEVFQQQEVLCLNNGEIALLPCCMFADIQREIGENLDYKIKADELHKRKIDIADEILVLNVNGYIGNSTRSEIEYAQSVNKSIKYLEIID